jgi:predicted nucleotide-binding protein
VALERKLVPAPDKPEALATEKSDRPASSYVPNNTEVFVIHGRNEEARAAMFAFLRALKLDPKEWGLLIKDTGEGSPYIGQILATAMDKRPAIVALLTPDDVVRLHPRLWMDKELIEEKEERVQARANVLFEAGMAFAVSPKRTVVVQLGEVKLPSDIGGRHIVHLTNDTVSRNNLATRLDAVRCHIDRSGSDWTTAGDFDGAVRGCDAPAAWNRVPEPQGSQDGDPDALSRAERDVLAMLFEFDDAYPLGSIRTSLSLRYDRGVVRFSIENLTRMGLVETVSVLGEERHRTTPKGRAFAFQLRQSTQ